MLLLMVMDINIVIENVIIAKETKNNYSSIMSENVPTTTKIEIIILSIRRKIID